jgi:hypothetical protein
LVTRRVAFGGDCDDGDTRCVYGCSNSSAKLHSRNTNNRFAAEGAAELVIALYARPEGLRSCWIGEDANASQTNERRRDADIVG